MQWRLAGGTIMAAARGLAIDGDELGAIRPGLAYPTGEGGREQRRVNPVHQNGQPTPVWHAVSVAQLLAEERQMRGPPIGDGVVIVAVGNRGADHQQQGLAQRVENAANIERVLDAGEMLEQRGQARPAGEWLRRSGWG
jgi:hypothetical protein